jgi:2-iminobutanoate/2-iminopropanoate deaminase
MRGIAAALLILSASAGAAPPNRATVEHFPAPATGGQPAPYANAVRVGDMLYLSGQTGDVDGQLKEGFEAQARQSMENVRAVLKERGLGFADVVKCTVMLSDMSKWSAFNAIYVPYFPSGKLPARSAIGANGLAGGALIELECWAFAGQK